MTFTNKRDEISRAFTATCPACGWAIRLTEIPQKGQYISCFECDTMLEVVRLAPLRLELAFESPFEGSYEDSDDDEPRQVTHYVEDGYDLSEELLDYDYYDEYNDD